MNYTFLIIGIILFFITIFDLIWTTLWVDGGAGHLSSMIGNFVWFVFGKIDKRGTGFKKFVGPVVLMSILVIWITTLWLAWTLIFASFIGGVVNTARNDAIRMIDYLYYAGYVLFTLGNGEITPTNGTVQLLTSLASASGMLNLSLAVSYILSMISGVIKRRSFASTISGMASSPEELVKLMWNGEDFRNSDMIFHSLADQLSEIAFEQRAFPLLNYYHSSDKDKSISFMLPVLYDAVNIIEYGVKSDHIVNALVLKNIRSTLLDYLESLVIDSEKNYKNAKLISYPNLDSVKEAGIEVYSQEEFEVKLNTMKKARRRISNVYWDNWSGLEANERASSIK